MKGTILCRKCGSRINEETGTCTKCEEKICIIKIYFKGKGWFYRRGFQHEVFTYPKAIKFLNYIRQEIDRLGKDFNPLDFTDVQLKDRIFDNQFDKWIKEKERDVKRGKRSPEYVRVLNTYNHKWYTSLSQKDVRDIKKGTLKELADSITTKSKTRKNIMDGLRSFFNWLYEAEIIESVPLFPVIEVDDADIKYALDITSQYEQLQMIPEDHRDIFEFETETGLRPGEVCALMVKDILISQESALIGRTFSGTHLREKTKQKKKYLIPLSDRALEIAVKHMQGKLPDSFLFIHPLTGRHYTRHTLGDLWNRYVDVPIPHYDGTRHSFCTQLVDAGVNPLQAKELMRHSSLKSTEHYYHGNVKTLKTALNKRTKIISLERGKKDDATEMQPRVSRD